MFEITRLLTGIYFRFMFCRIRLKLNTEIPNQKPTSLIPFAASREKKIRLILHFPIPLSKSNPTTILIKPKPKKKEQASELLKPVILAPP